MQSDYWLLSGSKLLEHNVLTSEKKRINCIELKTRVEAAESPIPITTYSQDMEILLRANSFRG